MSRYLRHNRRPPDDESSRRDIANALVNNLELVQKHASDRHGTSGGNVYVGIAGTAVMYHSLARLDLPELSSSQCFSNGDQRLVAATADRFSSLYPAKASFLETYVGVATLVIIRALQTAEYVEGGSERAFAHEWLGASKILQQVLEVIVQGKANVPDDGDCEVLYGRAGFLYSILLLRSTIASGTGSASDIATAIGSLVSDSSIKQLVDAIILRGELGAKMYASEISDIDSPALMWSWHGKRYLGAAHGVAGILHVLLLCPPSCISEHMPAILQTIEWLIGLQDERGNWPSKAPTQNPPYRTREKNELVQWCHGAPGFLILLSTMLRRSLSIDSDVNLSSALREKVISALERGAELVYSHGFLRKGVGLCHGVSGSIFALLTVSDVLPSNPVYLQQAIHLAHLATGYNELTRKGEMRVPDRKWSLYEGTAGMCCAWGEVLQRMSNEGSQGKVKMIGHGMPGFDDIQVNLMNVSL